MQTSTRDDIGAALGNPRTYADRQGYHAILAQLRREDPLYWAHPEGFRPFWVATKHADIVEIERQPDVFLSGPRLELFSIEQEHKIKEATGRDAAVGKTMLHMDGAEHRAYRGMSQAWFLPKNLKHIEARVDVLAKEYVDKLAEAGGEADFVKLVSELLPLSVILIMLGLPASEAGELLRLTRNFNGRAELPVPEGSTREELIVKGAQEIFDYFGAVYDARLKNPTDDVASVIAHAKVDGVPISRANALSYYLLLGLAGHDSSNGAISGGLLALIHNPGELEKLKARPDLTNSAAEEILRWVTPVNNFMRTAARDYELRGKVIKAGDGILLPFGSANRDEEVFEEPFRFNVERNPNPHVAFGYGAHMCLGHYLARVELRAFFRELIPRLNHVELAGEPAMLPVVTGNQLIRLPIRFDVQG
ncbi:MAG: cytochrome P450 [Steroidobacteraceae bacterium]